MSDSKRVLWLIDAGYLHKAQRTVNPNYEFSYLKLRQELQRQSGVVSEGYFLNSCPDPIPEGQKRFHGWIALDPPDGPGLILYLYPLKQMRIDRLYCIECGRKVTVSCRTDSHHILSIEHQKQVDVAIAVLAVDKTEDYDVLVLSSGDGDLMEAMRVVKRRGKELHLLVFKVGVSYELQRAADKILWIDDFSHDVRK